MNVKEAFSAAKEHRPEEPTPLVRETPPAKSYPLDALGPLKPPAEAVHDMTQAPPAIAAHAVLGVASLAAQGLADAETLHGTAPASLYLLTVAQSGERKSACDRLAMRPVREFEDELGENYREAMATYRDRLDMWADARKVILRAAKDDRDGARADLAKLGAEPEPPLAPSIVSAEPTLEGIVKNMPMLRASIGIFADEGGAFIGGHGMTQENRLRTIAGLSGLWDGTPVSRWRASDGISRFRGRRLAMHLMAQPVAAEGLLADPLAQGQGFLARFLLVEPKSAIGTRLRADHCAESETALDRFALQIGDMLRAPLPLRENSRNEIDPPPMRLDSAAREELRKFSMLVEKEQAPGESFEAVRPFASKCAEHAARLAAVLALYRNPEGRAISVEDMADAIELAAYYAAEAARLAGAATISKATAEAEQMRRWLLDSWNEHFVSATDAAQRGPFKETARVRAAFATLAKSRWLLPCPAGAEVLGKFRREAWRINGRGG